MTGDNALQTAGKYFAKIVIGGVAYFVTFAATRGANDLTALNLSPEVEAAVAGILTAVGLVALLVKN